MYYDSFTFLGIVSALVVVVFIVRLMARGPELPERSSRRSDTGSDDGNWFVRS